MHDCKLKPTCIYIIAEDNLFTFMCALYHATCYWKLIQVKFTEKLKRKGK